MLPKFTNMYRLTRDPELVFSNNGVAICRVGLACSEKYGEKENQLFLDATAFKKTAEMLATVQKGHRVNVLGKLQTEKWQDQNSGQNRSKAVLIIESFEFVEPKQQNSQQQQQPQNQGFQQQPSGGYQQNQNSGFQQPPDYGHGNGNPPDEDLPF